MNLSEEVYEVLSSSITYAKKKKIEYITPEVLLLMMCNNPVFKEAFIESGGSIGSLIDDLKKYIDDNIFSGKEVNPDLSDGAAFILSFAGEHTLYSGKNTVELPQIVHSLYQLKDCYAVYFLLKQDIEEIDILRNMADLYDLQDGYDEETEAYFDEAMEVLGEDTDDGGLEDDSYFDAEDEDEFFAENDNRNAGFATGQGWKQYAPCMNDNLESVNPLIGREEEMERTIQILCRKDKNNPLHIGEPGVGKTAITYGLARLINEGKVPEQLKGAKIYSMDLGSLIAGTHYRGDFEKRIKKVLNGISKEEKPII